MKKLEVRSERWEFARPFAISRGVRTHMQLVVAEITDGDIIARGECVPYPHYGETVEGVIEQISSFEAQLTSGTSSTELRESLQTEMESGAARNALDCALWDLEAKQKRTPAWTLAGVAKPLAAITAETIGIGTTQEMGAAAVRLKDSPVLKVKVAAEEVLARIEAVHRGAPNAAIILDANEAWKMAQLVEYAPALAGLGVAVLEQPVPAGDDECLREYQGSYQSPIVICADEACHTSSDLEKLQGKYQMINIKLDKTGGLTEALKLSKAATEMGFEIMVGCMAGTSLAMAPANLLQNWARFLDLDGPLLLKHDREHGIEFANGKIHPPEAELWG